MVKRSHVTSAICGNAGSGRESRGLALVYHFPGWKMVHEGQTPIFVSSSCYAFRMDSAGSGKQVVDSSAQVLLGVAKAISAHLDLPEVLEALLTQLKPMVHFDAIAVVVRDGDYARLHSIHIEGMARKAGESIQSIMSRKASDLNVEPFNTRIPIEQHPMSLIQET